MNNGKLNAVLRWALAPAVGATCFLLAPKVDSKHPPTDLATFFMTVAALLGAFFIALALLAATSPLTNYHIRQIIGYISFVYIALGALASVSGTIVSWPYAAYPIFFAITAGSGAATVLAVTRVGIANLFTQRQQDTMGLARNPNPPPTTG
jgi:hypothetical protein